MIYHDLAGWLMMPLALAMLWLELKFLMNLFVGAPIDHAAPLPLSAVADAGEQITRFCLATSRRVRPTRLSFDGRGQTEKSLQERSLT